MSECPFSCPVEVGFSHHAHSWAIYKHGHIGCILPRNTLSHDEAKYIADAVNEKAERDDKALDVKETGDWRGAIGAAPGFLGDELPEDVIRRSRDE